MADCIQAPKKVLNKEYMKETKNMQLEEKKGLTS
jgi:hypothetical protein